MYKCCDCGIAFIEPRTYEEKHEFWGAPCYETFTCCPSCGSDEIEECNGDEDEEDLEIYDEPE